MGFKTTASILLVLWPVFVDVCCYTVFYFIFYSERIIYLDNA